MKRKTYYKLYDKFNSILIEENPCKFIDNKCLRNRIFGGENGCCGNCSAISMVGCSIQPLRCKSQLCDTAFYTLSQKNKNKWRKLVEKTEKTFPSLLNCQTYIDL